MLAKCIKKLERYPPNRYCRLCFDETKRRSMPDSSSSASSLAAENGIDCMRGKKGTLASSPNAMVGRNRATKGQLSKRMSGNGETANGRYGDWTRWSTSPNLKASATILSKHGVAESIEAHLRNKIDTLFRTFCVEPVLRRSQRTGAR